jgi:hypothetical protein
VSPHRRMIIAKIAPSHNLRKKDIAGDTPSDAWWTPQPGLRDRPSDYDPTVTALALSGLARIALRTMDVAEAHRLCREALALTEGKPTE